MTISLDKKYRTRDGREVRLLMIDGGGEFSVIGAICRTSGRWESERWLPNGSYTGTSESSADLIEIKPRIKLERWVNVYLNEDGGAYMTKKTADAVADTDRIACVKITIDCEEGEGL